MCTQWRASHGRLQKSHKTLDFKTSVDRGFLILEPWVGVKSLIPCSDIANDTISEPIYPYHRALLYHLHRRTSTTSSNERARPMCTSNFQVIRADIKTAKIPEQSMVPYSAFSNNHGIHAAIILRLPNTHHRPVTLDGIASAAAQNVPPIDNFGRS